MSSLKIGDTVSGTIISLANYGAFIKLENDYMGLVHISEISSDFVHSIDHYVQVGDKVEAKVLGIEEDRKQVKLSFKDLEKPMKPIYRNKITDTEHGFGSLAEQLPKWIQEKTDNIDKNTNI